MCQETHYAFWEQQTSRGEYLSHLEAAASPVDNFAAVAVFEVIMEAIVPHDGRRRASEISWRSRL
jgi:hypothetical protein